MLQELIPEYLKPIRGREAQIQVCRQLTKALSIGSDKVMGFPTVADVRCAIQQKLSALLIKETGVKPGDEITYHKRRIHFAHKGADVYGWEHTGKKCRVVSVHEHTLSLNDGVRTMNSAVPLYCPELLAKVGVSVDFVTLDSEAKALADATKKTE